MNRIEELESTVARHRLRDGSYADVRINGADVAALLAVAQAARAPRLCPWITQFLADLDDALAPLLKEVTD